MQRLLRIGAVAMVVGITLLYPLTAPPAHRINAAHRELIRTGMTRADVEAIFGVKAGAYDDVTASPLLIEQSFLFNGMKVDSPVKILGIRDEQWGAWWIGREGAYCVSFDEAGCVTEVNSFPRPIVQPLWRRMWSIVRGGANE